MISSPARRWRRAQEYATRLIDSVVLRVTMTLSGALQNLHQLLGNDRHRLLTADELVLAERVRAGFEERIAALNQD